MWAAVHLHKEQDHNQRVVRDTDVSDIQQIFSIKWDCRRSSTWSVKEGTSAVLLQSGLGNEWWADSMECYCYLRNIQALLSDWKTPYEREFGVPCKGPVIPFGAMVEYHLISARDLSRLLQFGPKLLPSIFLGYALHAG